MAVGDNLYYSKVLTLAKGRVLLVPAEDSVRLGNIDFATDDFDGVPLIQMKQYVDAHSGNFTALNGIIIDSSTNPKGIGVDMNYIKSNIPVYVAGNGIIIDSTTLQSPIISIDLSAYISPNPILMASGDVVGGNYGILQISNTGVTGGVASSTGQGSQFNTNVGELGLSHVSAANVTTSIFLRDGVTEVTGLINYVNDESASYNARSIVDKAYVDSVIPNTSGFMHLTDALDESADGNKTFTGVTSTSILIPTRIYSPSDVSPNITFFNDLTNGKTMFSISGNSGAADVNYIDVKSVASGNNPILSANGISTNIGIILSPKGAGKVNISNLTGTGNRILITSSTGDVSAIANTTDTFVMTLVGGVPTWAAASGGGGSGTVTTVSIVPINGISGTVANASTTPAISLSLGAITPTSIVASSTITGSNLSGTNTGDITLGTFGTTPDPKGATLSSQVLTLQPANNTNAGSISLAAQILGAGVKTMPDTLLILNDKSIASSTLSTNTIDLRNTTTGVDGIFIRSTTKRVSIFSIDTNSKLVINGGTGNISQLYGEAIEVSAQTSTLTLQSNVSSISLNSSTGTFVESAKSLTLRNIVSPPTSVALQRSSGKLGVGAYFYNAGTPVVRSFEFWNSASTTVDLSSQMLLDYNGTTIHKVTQGGDFIINNTTGAIYWGNEISDGSWRIIRNGSDLDIQRRESGTYVSKQLIPAV